MSFIWKNTLILCNIWTQLFYIDIKVLEYTMSIQIKSLGTCVVSCPTLDIPPFAHETNEMLYVDH
jgi:hypothetical protein